MGVCIGQCEHIAFPSIAEAPHQQPKIKSQEQLQHLQQLRFL